MEYLIHAILVQAAPFLTVVIALCITLIVVDL